MKRFVMLVPLLLSALGPEICAKSLGPVGASPEKQPRAVTAQELSKAPSTKQTGPLTSGRREQEPPTVNAPGTGKGAGGANVGAPLALPNTLPQKQKRPRCLPEQLFDPKGAKCRPITFRDLCEDPETDYPMMLTIGKIMNALQVSTCSEALTSLERTGSLDLSQPGQRIWDLRPLGYLTNLREVNLSNHVINDLVPLKRLSKLRKLSLAHNQIADLEPIRALKQLETIDLSGNLIIDYTPLLDLNSLKEVKVDPNFSEKYGKRALTFEVTIVVPATETPVPLFGD